MSVILVPGDYSTISAAITSAEEGDEIHVTYGTYVENVDINKDNIAIIGIANGGGDYPVIQLPGTPDPSFTIGGITYSVKAVGTSGWELSTFDILSGVATTAGIYIADCSRFDIHDVLMEDTNFDYGLTLGVVSGYNQNFRIDSCSIYGNTIGIDDQYSTIGSVQVTSCEFSGGDYGIGFAPPTSPPESIEYSPIAGGYSIPGMDPGKKALYFVVKNKFTGDCRLSVECDEIGQGNPVQIVAYKNILMQTDNPVYLSETMVESRLYSPGRERYCIGGAPFLNFLGNYWEGYSSASENGIYSVPFIVSANHYDNYPLVGKWGPDYVSEGYYSVCTPVVGHVYDDAAIQEAGADVPLGTVTIIISNAATGAVYHSGVTASDGSYSIPGDGSVPYDTELLASCRKDGYIHEEVKFTMDENAGSQVELNFRLWTIHLYGR